MFANGLSLTPSIWLSVWTSLYFVLMFMTTSTIGPPKTCVIFHRCDTNLQTLWYPPFAFDTFTYQLCQPPFHIYVSHLTPLWQPHFTFVMWQTPSTCVTPIFHLFDTNLYSFMHPPWICMAATSQLCDSHLSLMWQSPYIFATHTFSSFGHQPFICMIFTFHLCDSYLLPLWQPSFIYMTCISHLFNSHVSTLWQPPFIFATATFYIC